MHPACSSHDVFPTRRRLQGTQVEAFSAHPGVIQTNLGRHMNGPAHWGMKIFMAAARWVPAMRAKNIPQVTACPQKLPTIYHRRFNCCHVRFETRQHLVQNHARCAAVCDELHCMRAAQLAAADVRNDVTAARNAGRHLESVSHTAKMALPCEWAKLLSAEVHALGCQPVPSFTQSHCVNRSCRASPPRFTPRRLRS